MLRSDSARSRLRLMAAGLAAAVALAGAAPAQAQSSACTDVQKILVERKSLVDRISAARSKKKMDAQEACGIFGKLVANGNAAVKWLEANKDWCQVPDGFANGLKADHGRVVSIRGKACSAAAQQAAMQKRAREGGGEGGGLLGGGGLTGTFKMPQGAL